MYTKKKKNHGYILDMEIEVQMLCKLRRFRSYKWYVAKDRTQQTTNFFEIKRLSVCLFLRAHNVPITDKHKKMFNIFMSCFSILYFN